MKNLDKLFKPKTIAVIGASNSKGSVGKAFMDNLVDGGYRGKVFPVSIKRKRVKKLVLEIQVKKLTWYFLEKKLFLIKIKPLEMLVL